MSELEAIILRERSEREVESRDRPSLHPTALPSVESPSFDELECAIVTDIPPESQVRSASEHRQGSDCELNTDLASVAQQGVDTFETKETRATVRAFDVDDDNAMELGVASTSLHFTPPNYILPPSTSTKNNLTVHKSRNMAHSEDSDYSDSSEDSESEEALRNEIMLLRRASEDARARIQRPC